MAVRFLLDTNICIYLGQKKHPEVAEHFDNLDAGEAAISVITQGELLYGAERSQNRERTLATFEEFFSLVPVLGLPERAGAIYGQLRGDLERRGVAIGTNDLWIAAHAKAENLILVTNNEREFRRVAGLRIENWAKR